MPELISPYDFALETYNGLSETNLENGYEYSNREMTISFKQPARVHFASPTVLFDDVPSDGGAPQLLASFIDWEQSQSYTTHTTIRFPYHVLVLSEGEETSLTYTEPTGDTQTKIWSIPSRVTQDDLVWYMNQCFEDRNVPVKWIPESDGYFIHADHVFSLSDNLKTIIPVSGSLSHTWHIPYDDGAFHANNGPMVGEYPVDITNSLSNIRLY